MRIKLTTKAIERLAAPDPSGRQKLHWDTELRGFGVLCSGTSGNKTYVVQRDLPGGRTRRVTVAPVNVLYLDKARKRAEEVLADFYKGIDPKAGRRGDATLREALEDYLRARASGEEPLRPGSARAYRDSVEKQLTPWLDTPLRTITRDMVETRLGAIAKTVSQRTNRKNGHGHAAANGAMRALRALYNFAADRAPPSNPMPPNPVKLKKQWLPVERRTHDAARVRHLEHDIPLTAAEEDRIRRKQAFEEAAKVRRIYEELVLKKKSEPVVQIGSIDDILTAVPGATVKRVQIEPANGNGNGTVNAAESEAATVAGD